uniref:Uncharacterized protein n=1 Tax=Oryza punctata TaxID=4537 RepID=A0A0E0L705_ORYPU
MGWWPPATPGTTGFLDASAMAQLFPPRQCGRVLVEDSRGIISHQLNLPSERRWRRNHKLEKCTFFFKEGRERPCRVDICSVAHMDERNTAAIRIESKRLMWLSKRSAVHDKEYHCPNVAFDLPGHSGLQLAEWWQQERSFFQPSYRNAFDSFFLMVCWLIWKERNGRIFEHKFKVAEQLVEDIKEENSIWKTAGFFFSILGVVVFPAV